MIHTAEDACMHVADYCGLRHHLYLEAVPDPQLAGVWVVRNARDLDEECFLIRADGTIEEMTYTVWPPKARI
jgi:hypothetical protein